MPSLRFAAYVVFGLLPATALGVLAVFVMMGAFVTGAMGAVLGPLFPIAAFGLLGSVAFWATIFAEPNDAIRMGLVCGIGAALLLLGFLYFQFREDLLYDSWLRGLSACSISSATAAAIYLARGGRPRLGRGGKSARRQHAN